MPGAMSVASAIPGARQGGPDTSGRLPTTAIGRHGAMQRLDGQLVLSPTDLTHHQVTGRRNLSASSDLVQASARTDASAGRRRHV